MRYGVNTRLLLNGQLEGIGWFSFETLKRICEAHPEHEFYFFFDRPFHQRFVFEKNVHPIVLFPPARHPFLYILYFEFILPIALRKYKIDVLISPDGFIPTFTSSNSVAVIHDINFEHRPKDVPTLTRWYYQFFVPRFARKAKRLATVSEYSRSDISKEYNLDIKNIDVLYNGSNALYRPISLPDQELTKLEHTNGHDYFIYLGSLNPRKNIRNLLLAFDNFKLNTQSTWKMVMVGKVMHDDSALKKTYDEMQFKEDVLFLGHLDSDKVHKLLGSAKALTYIPFFEGFGIPVIEAMYCDVPVLTSDLTSLPEVAGDAALMVNPNHVGEIATQMSNLANNPMLRQNLIEKGRIQREKFSWDKTAERFWSSTLKAS